MKLRFEGKTHFLRLSFPSYANREDSDEFYPKATLVSYLIFGVFVIVALVLNIGGAQDLHVVVGLSQVLHGCDHVQAVDPVERARA